MSRASADPKTPGDHQVIISRILKSQAIPADVIAQIIVHIDGAMNLTREETIEEIINKLSRTITVDQEAEVIHALRH